MRYVLILSVIILTGCDSKQAQQSTRRGLTVVGEASLKRLLDAQDDADGFAHQLDTIATAADYESIFVLTHAMFDLPWVPELEPQGRYDKRMPKLAVEQRLDALVAATEHDVLSAEYFRAIDGRGDVEAAKDMLLNWTEQHKSRLTWNGERFELRE